MATYLLDTNALQALPRRVLEAACAAGNVLLLSPISLWELLSHLGDEDFDLARANALKGQLCEVLHDPLAEMMRDVGCDAAVHPSRFRDREGVVALLRELEHVTSYAGFIGRQVIIEGETITVPDVAANIDRVFRAEHDEFVRLMQERCAAYIQRFERRGTIHLVGEQFCREAVELARGLQADARRAGCDVAFGRIADRTVLGAGYAVARACAYVGNVSNGVEPTVDPNDLEDYFICLHLGVSSDRTFVTNDRGTRTAISRTLAAFTEFANATGDAFHPTARVITAEEFSREVSP